MPPVWIQCLKSIVLGSVQTFESILRLQTHIPITVSIDTYHHLHMLHVSTESNQSLRASRPLRGNFSFQTYTPIHLFDLIFSPPLFALINLLDTRIPPSTTHHAPITPSM